MKEVSIKSLLDEQGTDKGKWYGGLYDVLLQPHRHQIRCVIEIGIGTLSPSISSSMSGVGAVNYRPGGSLRAWRDFFPYAEIYGVDIVADTLIIDEPRIRTSLFDSTDAQRVSHFLATIDQSPDLIIDDGSHDPRDQILTLRNFFSALRPGGLYIVEDVQPDSVNPILQTLSDCHSDCHSFVDRSWGTLVALVVRKADSARDVR